MSRPYGDCWWNVAVLLKDFKNIEVCVWQGLVVDFARDHHIGVMIRGVRALVDFGYEFELAMLLSSMK